MQGLQQAGAVQSVIARGWSTAVCAVPCSWLRMPRTVACGFAVIVKLASWTFEGYMSMVEVDRTADVAADCACCCCNIRPMSEGFVGDPWLSFL
jgi:hypothetical protein